jgi:hypothetical protein
MRTKRRKTKTQFFAAAAAPHKNLFPLSLSPRKNSKTQQQPCTDGPSSSAGRKQYTLSRPRERWSDAEHARFVEAIKLYGRAWGKVQGETDRRVCVFFCLC